MLRHADTRSQPLLVRRIRHRADVAVLDRDVPRAAHPDRFADGGATALLEILLFTCGVDELNARAVAQQINLAATLQRTDEPTRNWVTANVPRRPALALGAPDALTASSARRCDAI